MVWIRSSAYFGYLFGRISVIRVLTWPLDQLLDQPCTKRAKTVFSVWNKHLTNSIISFWTLYLFRVGYWLVIFKPVVSDVPFRVWIPLQIFEKEFWKFFMIPSVFSCFPEKYWQKRNKTEKKSKKNTLYLKNNLQSQKIKRIL